MSTDPYGRCLLQGKTCDNRTKSAFEYANRAFSKKTGKSLVVVQGCYHAGVSASAGTHDGGGVLDCSVAGLTSKQIHQAVGALRKAGFAAWHRTPLPGVWGAHIHAVLIGHKNAAPLAKSQMQNYKDHRDGLADNAVDNSWRPKSRVWSHRRDRPIVQG